MAENNARQLQGRHVLVTGAAGGIGRQLCKTLAARGARVACLDRDAEGLAQLVEGNDTLSSLVADLGDTKQLGQSVAQFQQEHGALNGLVNNAAFIHDLGSLDKLDPATWRDEIEGNLNNAYNITNVMLRGWTTPPSPGSNTSVVTIASVNALAALGHPAYSAAKAGLISYCRSVAMEYGRHGVRSNAILPGTVATPAWKSRLEKDPAVFDKLVKWYPLGRVVTPEEVALATCFLLSDDASAISGALLNVDCGLMAGNAALASDLTLEDF